ncbi:uncharacterized protein LOC109201125 isoform X1 [Tachysurus ichikawai]
MEERVLEKGHSFIPTVDPKLHKQLKTDVHRRLQITSFFGTNETDEQPAKASFTTRSNWEPPPQKIPQKLKDLIQMDKTTMKNLPIPKNTQPSNLSGPKKMAIKSPRNNHRIAIKPADKGSGLVIMDRPKYVQEALRQLYNPQYYKKLAQPIYKESLPIIQNKIKTLKERGFINQKQAKYLMGNPTLTNCTSYQKSINLRPPSTPPGHHIVSDCESESYRTAEFLDYHLNPLSTKHDRYIQDTYDFINKNSTSPKNDFEFNSQFFLQIKGTPMGKKITPAYANIYMAHWEQTAFEKCSILPTHYFRSNVARSLKAARPVTCSGSDSCK